MPAVENVRGKTVAAEAENANIVTERGSTLLQDKNMYVGSVTERASAHSVMVQENAHTVTGQEKDE